MKKKKGLFEFKESELQRSEKINGFPAIYMF